MAPELGLPPPRRDWRRTAACTGMSPTLFHPRDEVEATAEAPFAQSVCARCGVRLDCLLDALRAAERDGIRGGYTGAERRGLTRRLRRRYRDGAGPLDADGRAFLDGLAIPARPHAAAATSSG